MPFRSIISRDQQLKETEDALKLSEEKYRILIEGVKDYAIFMLSPEGYVQSWNEGAKKIKGYTEREILGKHFSVFYPREAKEKGYPDYELEEAKKKGRFEDEGWRLRKDGSAFYANVVITAIYNAQNQVIGFSKITRDLTERREAEERLRKSEQRYRVLIEGVKDYAIFMLDPEGYIISWNEGAKRLKRYEEHEIIGQHFSIFYPEEAKAIKYPEYELEQAIEKGRFEDEGWRIRKDGTRFYANVLITALFDKNKNLLGFSKITRDLTEKREAEEQLRKSEERYRLLVEGVRDYAIFMLDPEGYVISWNEGARRLKGYTDEDIIGKHFSIFYPREKQEIGFPDYELEQAKKVGRFEDEGWRIRKDGSRFYANVIITAVYSNDRLIGFSKITRDLTERKKTEEQLSRLNVELEARVKERTEDLNKTVGELKKINADLDNFIYTASHDLKAPVSNIEGLMSTLSETLNSYNYCNDEIGLLLEMINKSVLRFQRTIKDLTAINESQRSDQEDVGPIDLLVTIDDVAASIDHLVKESNAAIEIDIEKNGVFRFSKIHIRSLIYNFLTNAIKYRSPKRSLVIGIKSYIQGNEYVIEISDNGLGIKEENKEKIFQMFKRLHDHVEGSGIGLYLVRRIVDNAGGRIEVVSELDKGSTFRLVFPQ